MSKVFKSEERNRKKKEHITYSESYEVKFWIKTGEFWKQVTDIYFTASKGSHEYVEKRWKQDYANSKVKLVSVTYQ